TMISPPQDSTSESSFDVIGTHTYNATFDAKGTTYHITVQVFDNTGFSGTTDGSLALIGGPALLPTGTLAPSSLTGGPAHPNITSVNRPTFQGTAAPLVLVQVFAVQVSANPANTINLGQVLSGPDGTWSLTSPRLNDGNYTITVSMGSPNQFPTAPFAIFGP